MVDIVPTVFKERWMLVMMNYSLLLPSTVGTEMNKYYAVSFQAAVK